jgi:hypothetical protein
LNLFRKLKKMKIKAILNRILKSMNPKGIITSLLLECLPSESRMTKKEI